MGETTGISWTDHTFNLVWGCQRWSEACDSCYAETWAKRYGFNVWGPPSTTERRTFGEKHWNEPLRWNKAAEKAGIRARVFCSSMADVFEDHPTVAQERLKLWPLIEATPWLDWQLLTKRADNIMRFVPENWRRDDLGFPRNVWAGCTAENNKRLIERVQHLAMVPARIRWLSVEPQTEEIDIGPAIDAGVSWLVTGGESGSKPRHYDPDWARSIIRQCRARGATPFVKQMGEAWARANNATQRHGANPAEWPEDLRVQEFPVTA